MGISTEEDSRELRKIGREEINNDINEARMAEITNILKSGLEKKTKNTYRRKSTRTNKRSKSNSAVCGKG